MINENVFEEFPTLESERLIYREYTSADAEHVLNIRSNKEVMRYMDSNLHQSLSDGQKFAEENNAAHVNKMGICWVIVDKTTNEFIGDFSYWKLDRKNHRAEIGYTLKPDYWGKGYMRETMITLLNFGFEEFSLHSIEANINPANENSRKLLLKMGFEKEAYFRESYFYDGVYLDSEIYSLFKDTIR